MADSIVKAMYLNLVGAPGAIASHTYDTLPDDDDITLTGGAANTYGTYVEIASSVGAADVWLCGVMTSGLSAATDYKADVASGAAASEVTIAVVPAVRTELSGVGTYVGAMVTLPYPVRIVSATRTSGRCKDGTGTSTIDVCTFHATGLA